jgi:hypothetical protein
MCLSGDMNVVPPEYKSEALLLEAIGSVPSTYNSVMHAFGLRPSGFLDKILYALYITLMRAMFAKVHSVFDMHLAINSVNF